jgi:transposase
MPVSTILPSTPDLELNSFNARQDHIIGIIESIAVTSLCPLCGMSSRRIQNQYTRTLADLPWGGARLQLTLTVRRFFCDNDSCRRKIFTERLPGLVRPYGRKTARLEQALLNIGYAEGGEAGARTAASLGMQTSPDTILSLIRREAIRPVAVTPRVLGVDEWAFRRGHNYGTILIDLEKHERVDLLPDRNSETFAQWLKEHPGVEVISRDRSGIYANGATQGAPNATQVDDRFHLLKNLTEAVEDYLHRQHKALRTTAEAIAKETLQLGTEPTLHQASVTEVRRTGRKLSLTWQDRRREESSKRRERRLTVYQKVVELFSQGMNKDTIA